MSKDKGLTKPKHETTVGSHFTRNKGSKGETTMKTEHATPATKSVKNGSEVKTTDKLDSTVTAAETTAAPSEGTSEEKRRGAVPTMPLAMVYKLNGKVYAGVYHPQDGTSYVQSGKGEGSAKGALEDSGFRLSNLTLDGPEWISSKLPAGATLIGYATVRGFPLPAQD